MSSSPTQGPVLTTANPNIPQSWIAPYYPSFDGLRGIAILAVFLRHYAVDLFSYPWLDGLWCGVDLFFVLSGFLITGILFDTLGEPNYFRNFYIRRALRIFPIYYGFFLVLLLAWIFLHQRGASKFVWTYAFYLGNLLYPFIDTSKHYATVFPFHLFGRSGYVSVGYFWSLCVEEQFYLVWPLLVYSVRSRTRLMHLALAGIIGTLLLRILLLNTLPQSMLSKALLFASTYTRADSLLVGAWCALWLRGAMLSRMQLRRLCYLVGVPSLAVLGVGVALTTQRWPHNYDNPFIATVGFTLIAVTAAALLLLSLDEHSWIHAITRLRGLMALGIVSYGFYILQGIPEGMLSPRLRLWHPSALVALAALVALFLAMVVAAQLSFRFYEQPFLRLKKRLAPSHHSGPSIDRQLAEEGQ